MKPVVKFCEEIDENLAKFAVIVSRYKDNWVFCRHKDRDTWEIPGGHREKGESLKETAKRELFEETGAVEYSLKDAGFYSVNFGNGESFGALFYADISILGEIPESEIAEIAIFNGMPIKWTYQDIQPNLIKFIIDKFTF